MLLTNIFDFVLWAAIIEFIGALFIIGYLLAALILLLQRRDIRRARLLVADGIIYALSFKVAGSLLKTISLHTWQQIWMFAAILALRTVLKQVFMWERTELGRPI
jgi:uncharacterized membrane protein